MRFWPLLRIMYEAILYTCMPSYLVELEGARGLNFGMSLHI